MVELPKGVHRVVAGGREYFYWHPGRGTKAPGERVRLPDDPQSPEFWNALRALQGNIVASVVTFGAVMDLYQASPDFAKLSKGTKPLYLRQLRIARAGFGELTAESMRPSMVRGVLDGLADTPAAANNFLSTMRSLSKWGLVRDHFNVSLTEGLTPYETTGGHKPWTPAQLVAAEAHLTGMVRRGWLLARYTGQRGSDVVRLGETFIDDGGFRLAQQKTGREVWCPIDDALAAEMATWARRPGPYLQQASGRPYTRKLLDRHFFDMRQDVPGLADVTLHGLRATRIIELRREGLTTAQIQDQVGMSLAMIERYCRFADKKASGKASVVSLAEKRRARNENRT